MVLLGATSKGRPADAMRWLGQREPPTGRAGWRGSQAHLRPQAPKYAGTQLAAGPAFPGQLAVAAGFEPAEGCPSRAFEARSLGRSDTPPPERLPKLMQSRESEIDREFQDRAPSTGASARSNLLNHPHRHSRRRSPGCVSQHSRQGAPSKPPEGVRFPAQPSNRISTCARAQSVTPCSKAQRLAKKSFRSAPHSASRIPPRTSTR